MAAKMRLAVALVSVLATPALAWAEPAQQLNSDQGVDLAGVSSSKVNKFLRIDSESPRMNEAYSRGLQHELDQDRKGTAFGVAFVPVAPRANLFARVGYGDGSSFDRGNTSDSLKLGVGAEYSMGSRNGFRADFTRYDADRARPKANVFSLGFAERF
jgi:hypothetical protein